MLLPNVFICVERLLRQKTCFVRYLQSFPQGAFSVNASYYLGVIAYNQQDYASASSWLDKVLEYPDSKFSTEAMGMSADIAYKGKDYPKALGLYKRMADRALSQEERCRQKREHAQLHGWPMTRLRS